MESMSNIPHYLPKSRSVMTLGHIQALDGVIHDGLWDVYNDQHMGVCAGKSAWDHGFSREEQDAYAQESYRRAQEAVTSGFFEEIVNVTIPQRRGEAVVVTRNEEPRSVNLKKLPTLQPAFDKNGTVTAAYASSLNDCFVALVLMTEQAASYGNSALCTHRTLQ